jgi:hypothetical protein
MTAETEAGAAPRAFWPSCGYQLLDIDDDNRLQVNDEFLRYLYRRPELEPVAESCASERKLHRALLKKPQRGVSDAEIEAIADADARENYRFALTFRDLLLTSESLENAYMQLVSRQHDITLPVMLADLLVQLLVRHILNDVDDVYQLRAAELLFRRQKISLDDGILLADAELLMRRQPQALSVLQSLIQQAGGVTADSRPTLNVLNKSTLSHYWHHSEAHDLVISLNLSEPGIGAFCRVLERWLAHFHDARVNITPLNAIQDEHWRWHIGLDSESNRILNQLYQQQSLDEDDQQQLLALFQLEFADPQLLRSDMRGFPVYLGLAMDDNGELRVKPQNLLTNLPLSTVV